MVTLASLNVHKKKQNKTSGTKRVYRILRINAINLTNEYKSVLNGTLINKTSQTAHTRFQLFNFQIHIDKYAGKRSTEKELLFLQILAFSH